MPTNIPHYSLLISCPGDLQDYVKIIKRAIRRFNDYYSSQSGVFIEVKYWKDDAFPQSDGKPQNIIDKQLVHRCDACIALLWTQFGTPTDEYGSGTEEEIEEMLSSDKQVFMYFSDAPQKPSLISSVEKQRVDDFKERYKKKGLYYTFESKKELEEKLIAHLATYFISKKALVSESESFAPKLDIVCFKGDHPTSELSFCKFSTAGYYDIDKSLLKIKTLVEEINNLHLQKQEDVRKPLSPFDELSQIGMQLHRPVVIDSVKSDFICELSSLLKIYLSSDFFGLGDLKTSSISLSGNNELNGSPEEKTKYRKILELFLLMLGFNTLIKYCTDLEQLLCTGLALRNSGTQADEDIDVTLTFPKDTIIRIKDLPTPSNECSELMIKGSSVRKLFGIRKSQNAFSYWEKNKKTTPIPTNDPVLNVMHTHNYVKDYYLLLRNEFAYTFYLDGEMDIVEIHFDDIKQNTVISFPTVFFVNNEVDTIEYTIRSKHVPEIVKGVLRKGKD